MFVFPKFREDLLLEVQDAMTKVKYPERVKVLFIEDVPRQAKTLSQGNLTSHFEEFEAKHLKT